ncbi:MAG: FAD-dependent oxidoreductase [Bacteroidota bacterium]
MKTPHIVIVDDDPQVLKAITRDVRKKYRKEFKVLSTNSANEALEALEELKKKSEVIALFLSDQRMPEMLGVEFLAKAKQLYPKAKSTLLTAYSDTDAAIKAINDVQLDYYFMKPWDPPEEKLYPVIDDLLEEWQSSYKPDFAGIRIVGYQWSPLSHTVKDFLSGNLIPYRFLDIETDERAREVADLNNIPHKDLPLIVFEDGSMLTQPSVNEIGEKVGLSSHASEPMYDVVIIGAGPSGLAAGVYGGSEGLNTLVVERRAPGGQAGTSSRIENYLGFPKGLSGAELTRRATSQASRLGAEFLSPQEVSGITLQDQYKIVSLKDGSEIRAKAVIVTTGVDYRRLEAEGIHDFTGAGVYYGAATTEAAACKNADVYIVGGGNSAGQGAMYLSNFARHVYILIRKPDLTSSMSHYLIEQINGTNNITVLGRSQVTKARGDEQLTHLTLEDMTNGEHREVEAKALFIFIGAKPYTEWMGENIIKNERGFIETGRSLFNYYEFHKNWKKDREPFMLETSVPGIFAAGDVRAGAMNRVASAVGEGAMAISFVHKYLAEE